MLMHWSAWIQLLPVSSESIDDAGVNGVSTAPGLAAAQDKANEFAGGRRSGYSAPRKHGCLKTRCGLDQDRQGAIVGKAPGKRLEDRQRSAQATIWQPKEGQTAFNGTGSTTATGIRQDELFFHYEYLTKIAAARSGRWYVVRIVTRRTPRIAPPRLAVCEFVGGNEDIDRKAFLQGFVNQVGNIKAMIVAILAAVLHAVSARPRQHHGAGGARTDERDRRAEDARVLEPAHPGTRSR
jgi:hypothetical protein